MAEVKIDANSIKPNSYKYRDEQMRAAEQEKDRDKLAPIVKKDGIVSTKKPLAQKFAETFMSEDVNDIKSYILLDVIIPGIKNAVLKTIAMAFYGTDFGRNITRRSQNNDRTDYRSYYDKSTPPRREDRRERDRDRRSRDDRLDYRNIVLLNRDDTEEVIDQLHKRIEKYGAVSIGELFDLIDEPSNPNDNNWGWTDKRDIGLRRVSRGYLIDVSEAEYLD